MRGSENQAAAKQPARRALARLRLPRAPPRKPQDRSKNPRVLRALRVFPERWFRPATLGFLRRVAIGARLRNPAMRETPSWHDEIRGLRPGRLRLPDGARPRSTDP